MAASTDFFGTDRAQQALGSFSARMHSAPEASEFEKARNSYIQLILNSMRSEHDNWNSACQLNIEWIGNSFLNDLTSKDQDVNKQFLDDVFSMCFRFLFELYLSTKGDLAIDFGNAKDFALRELGKFEVHARNQIEYAVQNMPISLFKAVANNEEIGSIKEFVKVAAKAETFRTEWDKDLQLREAKVERLKTDLQRYQSGFNFVGLFQGFEELASEKQIERKSIALWLKVVGAVAIVPLLLEIAAAYFNWISITNIGEIILVTVPTVSLVLISLYYFRVLLHSYQGVKTQLLQIDLRKTLCRFIQHYADYAAEIKSKDKESLAKFENLIFSGLVMDGEKLPSAYDGLEQLAKLVKSARP